MAVEKRIRKKIKKLREALKKIGKCDDKPFTEQELQKTLRSEKSTAPGLDGITYNAIRFLTTVSGNPVPKLYSMIWSEQPIPKAWKKSLIIPVSKPGKPGEFRPISLTSCLCKIESVVSTLKVYNQDGKKMELGTPQGGIPSPTLFNIQMNVLGKINIPGIIINIYADDRVVQASTNKRMKRAIRAYTSLSYSIGLVISPEKTKMIDRGTHNPLILQIQGQRIEKVAQYKYMGVILSNRCHKLYEVKRLVKASAVSCAFFGK
ncbi:uncharacterized protein [Palaemon carinicauda]|uniref:uncharacterized protein n=1 Tax=Palaemon carinicauda TaxID=392227 RepID=UPI0035B69D5B